MQIGKSGAKWAMPPDGPKVAMNDIARMDERSAKTSPHYPLGTELPKDASMSSVASAPKSEKPKFPVGTKFAMTPDGAKWALKPDGSKVSMGPPTAGALPKGKSVATLPKGKSVAELPKGKSVAELPKGKSVKIFKEGNRVATLPQSSSAASLPKSASSKSVGVASKAPPGSKFVMTPGNVFDIEQEVY
jgi:hypothetical protein